MRLQYDAALNFVWASGRRVVFGPGVVSDLGLEVDALGCKRALLVTDRVLRQHTDVVARAEKALGSRLAGIFDEVEADSGVHVCNAGAARGRDIGADAIVSVGGGSVIDTGKGIAILLREGGELSQYEGFQLLTRPQTPHVAVPTTAGTGSEVTFAAVIKDHARHQKLIFASNHIIPDTALLDPELTLKLPPGLTAATGMDALTHAIEAMHSLQREPFADALGLHAIRLVRAHLPTATKSGADLVARGQMLLAATLAGLAFSNAQVGLVHAMAHTLGGQFGVHHGLANSICLPHCLRFNAADAGDVYAEAGAAFGLATAGKSGVEASELLAAAVADFAAELGLKTRLRDVGVPHDALAGLAEATLFDGAIVYNPRVVLGADEALQVYEAAY